MCACCSQYPSVDPLKIVFVVYSEQLYYINIILLHSLEQKKLSFFFFFYMIHHTDFSTELYIFANMIIADQLISIYWNLTIFPCCYVFLLSVRKVINAIVISLYVTITSIITYVLLFILTRTLLRDTGLLVLFHIVDFSCLLRCMSPSIYSFNAALPLMFTL